MDTDGLDTKAIFLFVLLIAVIVGTLGISKYKKYDTESSSKERTSQVEEEPVNNSGLTEEQKAKGCVVCDEEGGICCPTNPDPNEALTEEQKAQGCVVCDEEGGICCPLNLDPNEGLTEEQIAQGCVVCDEEGGICCPTGA